MMSPFTLDPTHVHFILTIALHNAQLPCAQAQAVFAQAWHQYWVRAPAAQVVVHGTDGEPCVVMVGRQ